MARENSMIILKCDTMSRSYENNELMHWSIYCWMYVAISISSLSVLSFFFAGDILTRRDGRTWCSTQYNIWIDSVEMLVQRDPRNLSECLHGHLSPTILKFVFVCNFFSVSLPRHVPPRWSNAYCKRNGICAGDAHGERYNAHRTRGRDNRLDCFRVIFASVQRHSGSALSGTVLREWKHWLFFTVG